MTASDTTGDHGGPFIYPAQTQATAPDRRHLEVPAASATNVGVARADAAPESLDVGGVLEPFFRNFLAARFRDITDFGPAVPDPNALAVFGLGLLALGFLRRLAG